MSLDDRLHLAREEYRSLPSPALPSSLSSAATGSRRAIFLAAAAVVVLGGLAALALLLADDDDTSSLDVIGPDPTTTSTRAPMQIVVPDLVGLEVSRAREAVTALGIEMTVNERDGDLPDATVIAQEPGAGTEITTGGPDGSTVVGVRTALPVPPASVDCPAMAQLRSITPDQTTYLPDADAVALDNVRTLVDQLDTKLRREGLSESWGDAVGVHVGEGIVPSHEQSGPDGEPTSSPPLYHIVVEVSSSEMCPYLLTWNGIAIWGTVGWPTSAETQPAAEPDPESQPEGAIAEHDPAIVLEPAGPYADGQQITLTTPEGYREDWINDRARLCAIVADDPAGPTETCDPLDSAWTESTSATGMRIALSQRVFTPTGYRDCNEPTVTCRLVVRHADGGWRATDALRFSDEPRPPAASLTVTPGADAGTFVLDPEGFPGLPADLQPPPSYLVRLCAFDASMGDIAPFGEDLWNQGFGPSLPYANCELMEDVAQLDATDPNAALDVTIPGRFHSYSGRSDCRRDRCFVQVTHFQVQGTGIFGENPVVTAAMVPFDSNVELPPPPSISIVEPGPHRAGETITVEINGLAEGRTTSLAVCHVDRPWGCGFDLVHLGIGNGTYEKVLPDTVAGCGPEQCYLELDGRGEGLPPLATVPLPIAQE
jgi:hypothetical protein